MNTIPYFLTRYYVQDENEFASLSDYPFYYANKIKKAHYKRSSVESFYKSMIYLAFIKTVNSKLLKKQLLYSTSIWLRKK